MTNEEAIKILKGAIKKPNTEDGYIGQALTMAIKALEQPSVTDFSDKCKECGKILNDKLQTRWIPVNERLPENDDEVLVTVLDKWGKCETLETYYMTKLQEWAYKSNIEKIIAWMPLPTPFEPQESEDKE